MDKIALDERLERASQLIMRARIFYELWFYFKDDQTRPAIFNVMERFQEFFCFDHEAHFVAFIVHMAALFEKRSDTINLPQLAKEIRALSPQRDSEVDALLCKTEPLARKIKILRNNLFAHRSAFLSYTDAFKEAHVTPDELRNLTELALEITNRLMRARGSLSDAFFNPLPREHAEAMMKALGSSE